MGRSRFGDHFGHLQKQSLSKRFYKGAYLGSDPRSRGEGLEWVKKGGKAIRRCVTRSPLRQLMCHST